MSEPLRWERILDNLDSQMYRAIVYGGWLVKYKNGAVAFVSDPNLDWEVETRPVPAEPPHVAVPPPIT